MTIADVRKIAMKNYTRGGDVIVECWTDKDIEDFLKRNKNPMKALQSIMDVRTDEFEAARYFSGYDEDEDEYIEEEINDYDEYVDDDRATTSCYYMDYSPSNPYDAPGMSVSDVI